MYIIFYEGRSLAAYRARGSIVGAGGNFDGCMRLVSQFVNICLNRYLYAINKCTPSIVYSYILMYK